MIMQSLERESDGRELVSLENQARKEAQIQPMGLSL